MILFDVIVTIIESFIFSFYLICAYDLKKRISNLLVLTFIFFIETFLFNNIWVNNFILFFVELSTIALICFIYFKKIRFENILIAILGIGTILISNLISLFLMTNIFGIINYKIEGMNFYIVSVILSKIIYIIFCDLMLKMIRKNKITIQLSRWWALVAFFIIIIFMTIVLIESIIFGYESINLLKILLMFNIFLFVISIVIYFRLVKNTKEKIALTKIIIRNDYLNKNYSRMNFFYNETLKDRHRMLYILMHLQHLLALEQYDQISSVLKSEIDKNSKYQFLVSTSNPYFDYILCEKLSFFKSQDYDIKTTFQIKRLQILENEDVVNVIIKIVELVTTYADERKELVLIFNQTPLYLLTKISVSSTFKGDVKNDILDDPVISSLNIKIRNNELEIAFLIKVQD